MTEEDLKRFWAKVDRNGPVTSEELGNCWVWTAAKRSGYGAFSIKSKAYQAHRLIYEEEYGEVPDLLRHKCNNKVCVRPDHLAPVQKEILSPEQVDQARRLAAEGHSIQSIEEQVGGSRATLLKAIQGLDYPDAPTAPVQKENIYHPNLYKLTEEQYREIIEALKKPFYGQGRYLAKKYNVHPSTITAIKKKKLRTIRGASQEE